MKIFIDTNYFLRLLLGDIEKQSKEAKQIFSDGAIGRVKLFTSTIVLFEIYWVLSSFYRKRKSELIELLTNILKMSFVDLEERELLQEAVKLFKKSNLDLEDSYNLVYAKRNKASDFASFDRKLTKKFSSI